MLLRFGICYRVRPMWIRFVVYIVLFASNLCGSFNFGNQTHCVCLSIYDSAATLRCVVCLPFSSLIEFEQYFSGTNAAKFGLSCGGCRLSLVLSFARVFYFIKLFHFATWYVRHSAVCICVDDGSSNVRVCISFNHNFFPHCRRHSHTIKSKT